MSKEASARLIINTMLESSWRRLVDTEQWSATVVVESNVSLQSLWDDFEHTNQGFIDYLLVDDDGFPLCVLEAKSSDKDPLIWKEQARKYALAKNIRFIILSNGKQHYFWDRISWNPQIISHFPRMEEMIEHKEQVIDHAINDFVSMKIESGFLAKIKKSDYASDPEYQHDDTRWSYCKTNKLRFMRRYQVEAIQAIQRWVQDGKQRFLFEMATGTGKTLTSAGIINAFLKSWLAKRVLFLVDRIELENQAWKSFSENLWIDYHAVIFKKNKNDRKQAQIVVSTIQTFAYNNKYKELFSPYDFGLIISDESHRSISGANRTVFEYFIGYKLGLTATPKDYLKKIDKEELSQEDPRALERRQLLDTYEIFGCKSWDPTYRYSLMDGVNDPEWPFLVNPVSIDCRTDITTQLLSESWYTVTITDEEGEELEKNYGSRQFERTFFSQETNYAMMKTFMDNALRDPISGEIGKTIIFAVSRKHAAKLTQMLNELAHEMFPWKYNSDFAMQITSDVVDAQQFTINFANNKLSGHTNFLPDYDSSKTRICVTVGMMTTGYDCEDILNLCLCRPIFSPTDFVQIKGRGTRLATFEYEDKKVSKQDLKFKLFDFFANCEYFEEKYDYDQILVLPKISPNGDTIDIPWEDTEEWKKTIRWAFDNQEHDYVVSMTETIIGADGMKIDRELYMQTFEKEIQEKVVIDERLQALAESFDELGLEKYAREHILDKPTEYYTIDKLNQSYWFERILWLGEMMMKALGLIRQFKTKKDIIDEARDNFIHSYERACLTWPEAKQIFRQYCTDNEFRWAIDTQNLQYFSTKPTYLNAIKQIGSDCLVTIKNYVVKENSRLLQLSYR